MSAGHVILLHGASSSGKSSLARAVQARIALPFMHYSIDHLRDSGALPLERVRSGEFAWADFRGPFFDGFHRSIAAFALAGNNLIVEHIFDTEGWLDRVVRLLAECDVFFVGLHCSVDELNRREAARGDRPAGSAEADFHTIHRGLVYDLELDCEEPVEANAERLLAAWGERRAPGVFARMAGANGRRRVGG